MARSVVVGTAGHIDHGKSALVLALTGTDPDRLKEEKARGITIDLGFAHTTIGDIEVAFVDVPGHERFVKNMLAGVGGIDLVMLVVAADESVMPQTREHFDICRLLCVPAGLIALTKSLGKELAGYEIAVNAVTPAAAKTAIFDQLTQQHIDFMLSKIPKGRFVLVEELAAMVAWLASEDCAFSTGAVFDISGGRATY